MITYVDLFLYLEKVLNVYIAPNYKIKNWVKKTLAWLS